MNQFQYFGDKPIPRPRIYLVAPDPTYDREQYRNINTFRKLFRNEVSLTVKHSGGFFRSSIYNTMSSQYGAFDRLEEIVEHSNYHFNKATLADSKKDEFLVNVQIRVPTIAAYNSHFFHGDNALAEGAKGYVIVNFYAGVCREFTTVLKKNELVESALKEFEEVSLQKNQTLDPEKVISGILKQLRLERRYNYEIINKRIDDRFFFQSPEGFIYRIEIAGYSAVMP